VGAGDAAAGGGVTRRLQGTFTVDPWGLDLDLLDRVAPLADLRWSIAVDGERCIPADGPAVLVSERRLSPSEPLVLARAVRRSTGRVLRVVGIPDVAPLAPVLRRQGGAVDHPAEVAALLRAGGLVLARRIPDLDVPVISVRTHGWEIGRRWRVTFSLA
jgi:hypothetical protein